MLVAVISDIHANMDALQAVLRESDARGVEQVACLGDVVGYGPEPAACVDLVRERCTFTVLGNHDEAAVNAETVKYLPADGQAAVNMHREMLSPEQLDWLAALPLQKVTDLGTYVHAAPEEPENWPRLESFSIVRGQFAHFDTPLCFVGHSHRPGIAAEQIGVLSVRAGHRFLVDVGSVGQPRDGDPRASFVVFDTERFACEIVRVPYNTETVARKIKDLGLPSRLGDRLRHGR